MEWIYDLLCLFGRTVYLLLFGWSMDMVIIEIFESAISLSLPPVNPLFRPKGQRTKGPSALPPFDIVTQIIITIIHHRCCNTDHNSILNHLFV